MLLCGWFADKMPPKDKRAIQTFQQRLIDESSETDHSKGSVEVHRTKIDPEANRPQTQALAAQIPMEVSNSSQSEEEEQQANGDGSDSSLPQMTPSHSELELESESTS